MKYFKRFLLLLMFFVPCVSGANVATTAGSNLTAWNGNSGATNNNNWNTLMNNRTLASGGAAPTADFGNCDALIMRCAQPKCSACTSLEIAKPIVEGCVNSNTNCKKHGDTLVQSIAAQIVANANAKFQEKQLAAQTAAAQAAAAQNSQQMQQMQAQMQQMQAQLQQQNAQQNAQQMASMQAALDEQKALVAQAQAQAAAAQQAKIDAQTTPGVTVAQQAAIDSGVSEDILVRQQVSGQILSSIENAEAQLKELKRTMDNIFQYAGCDARGNNCTGPKRVKIFKEKAMGFFEPYDAIADEMYDALDTALAVGVDISDVIMMLSGTCNKWGKYMCTGDGKTEHQPQMYGEDCVGGKSVVNGKYSRGNQECHKNQIIPPQDDVRCSQIGIITGDSDEDTVERNWLSEAYDGDKLIRVGCATSALESISVLGRRKSNKNRTVDLETLERMILQDAPEYSGNNRFMPRANDAALEKTKYCALTPRGYERLRNAISQKKLPSSKICVSYDDLYRNIATEGVIGYGDYELRDNCSNYIHVTKEAVCDNIAKLHVDVDFKWDCADSNTSCEETEKLCKIISSDHCWDGETVIEKSEYEKKQAINKNITTTKNIKKDLGLSESKCREAGINVSFKDGLCYCGENVFVLGIDKKCTKDYVTGMYTIEKK